MNEKQIKDCRELAKLLQQKYEEENPSMGFYEWLESILRGSED